MSEMSVVFENVSDYQLEWLIKPVTPAHVKVIRLFNDSLIKYVEIST